MRGEVVRYSRETGDGTIIGDDGKLRHFRNTDTQEPNPLRGMIAEFEEAEDGSARNIVLSPPGTDGILEGNVWDYFRQAMRKYVDGEGRARRKEYWSFVLFKILIILAALSIDIALNHVIGREAYFGAFTVVAVIIFFLPSITVSIRRLHDVGLTGWLYLLNFLPFGELFMFVIALIPSQKTTNTHGNYPKRQDVTEASGA